MLAFSFVPEPDKTNKLVHPAKTQISLDIHPVLPVFDVRMKFGSLANHKVHIEDWSNWADVQADQFSQGAQVILLFLSCSGSFVQAEALQLMDSSTINDVTLDSSFNYDNYRNSVLLEYGGKGCKTSFFQLVKSVVKILHLF